MKTSRLRKCTPSHVVDVATQRSTTRGVWNKKTRGPLWAAGLERCCSSSSSSFCPPAGTLLTTGETAGSEPAQQLPGPQVLGGEADRVVRVEALHVAGLDAEIQ